MQQLEVDRTFACKNEVLKLGSKPDQFQTNGDNTNLKGNLVFK